MRVLLSVRGPSATTNPYVVQLAGAVTAAGAEVRWFGWRTAILGRYDVLHVHWPEVLVRRAGRAARLAAQARFVLVLARLRLRRTPVVRTVHNLAAHEPPGLLERLLLAALDRRTAYWILLNPHTPLPRPGPSRVIPIGSYADWYAGYPVGAPVPGRLLTFGLLRPYKGIDVLLAAFAGLADPAATLRVVGRPVTGDLRALVESAAAADPRLTAVLEHVDDAALVTEIGAAQLVVLPYRALHNSGALLLALALGRPVLAPAGDTVAELAAEVGPGWVTAYAGELTADVLAGALAATATPPAARPDLSRRQWPLLGRQHVEAYRAAAGGGSEQAAGGRS